MLSIFFSPVHFIITNQFWIIYISKRFIPGDNALMFFFLVNIFKNRINCCSIVGTVSLRVSTKQIRDFSIFNVTNTGISRIIPSSRCVTAGNSIWKCLDFFNKHNISLEDTFSFV
jgi:hypothetical protein